MPNIHVDNCTKVAPYEVKKNTILMRFLLVVLLLFTFGEVSAQHPVSFDEALELMRDNSRAIAAAQYGVETSYNELRATRGLYFPRVDLTGAYLLMQKDVSVELGGARGVVTQSVESLINKGVASGLISPDFVSLIGDELMPIIGRDWNYKLQDRSFGFIGVMTTMPIYAGGRIRVANRVAALGLESSQYALMGVNNASVTELVERYYGVILARELVAVRREVVSGVEKHLYDAKIMEQEGVIAHSVILFLEYKLSEAERDLVAAQNKLDVAELALRVTLGCDFEVTPTDRMFIGNMLYDIEYYRDAAIRLNPLLGEAVVSQQLAEEGVNVAKASFAPEIVAMGGASLYSYQLSTLIPRWTIGVGVNLTLFGGFANQRRYQASLSRVQSVRAVVEKSIDDIILLVDKEYNAVVNSVADMESVKRSLLFAENYYDVSLQGFYEGVTSSADLADARIALAASKVEYLDSVYSYLVALARLLEVSGLSSDFMLYRSNAVDVVV